MGRKIRQQLKAGDILAVTVKIPFELVSKLDERAKEMSTENPGMSVTRTDIIRVALFKFLDMAT